MSYKLILRDRAVVDLQEAYDWYELQLDGLGERFIEHIKLYFEQIIHNPNQFRNTYNRFREVFIQKFPFIIVYFVEPQNKRVVITAVFHTSVMST